MRSKILGIDYGLKKVGLAMSDELHMYAHEYQIFLHDHDNRKLCAHISEIIDKFAIDRIVIGMPKNMDGTLSEQSYHTKEFISELEKLALPIYEIDERLTSKMASAIMQSQNINTRQQKKYEDMLAAKIILQTYLDYQ